MEWSYKINSTGPLAADGTCEFSCESVSDSGTSIPFTVSCKPSDLSGITNVIEQRALELAGKFELSEIIPVGEILQLEKVPGYQTVIDSASFNHESSTVDIRYSVWKGEQYLASGVLSVSDPGMAQALVADAVSTYATEAENLASISFGTLNPIT